MKRVNLQVKTIQTVNFDADVPDELYEKLTECFDNGFVLDKDATLEEAIDVVEFLSYVCPQQDPIDFEFEIEDLNDDV